MADVDREREKERVWCNATATNITLSDRFSLLQLQRWTRPPISLLSHNINTNTNTNTRQYNYNTTHTPRRRPVKQRIGNVQQYGYGYGYSPRPHRLPVTARLNYSARMRIPRNRRHLNKQTLGKRYPKKIAKFRDRIGKKPNNFRRQNRVGRNRPGVKKTTLSREQLDMEIDTYMAANSNSWN